MAFRNRFGSYKYLIIPFRLYNTPAIFQMFINQSLKQFIDKIIIVYLNNILVFFNNKSKHKNYIKKVLKQLLKIKLFYKLEKYKFEI